MNMLKKVIQVLVASWNHVSTKVSNIQSGNPLESLKCMYITDAVMYKTKSTIHRFPSFLPEELHEPKTTFIPQ